MTVLTLPTFLTPRWSRAISRQANRSKPRENSSSAVSKFVRLAGRRLLSVDAEGRPVDEAVTILEALAAELHEAATRTIIQASCWNYLAQDNGSAIPSARVSQLTQSCLDQLPTAPSLYLPLARWRDATGLTTDELNAIDQFFSMLAPANAMCRQAETDIATLRHERAIALHALRLSRRWSACANHARDALAAMRPAISAQLNGRYVVSSDILTDMTRYCGKGEWPCINRAGGLHRPELPQRRSAHRIRLGEMINLTVASPFSGDLETHAVFATNVSAGGLGIQRTPHLSPDAAVTVELIDGRRLEGFVAWAHEGAAGIRWTHQLSHSDPLIAS
ncbi:MAG: hypothetical protein AAGG72_08275 [Pseudomonadota bacterium]